MKNISECSSTNSEDVGMEHDVDESLSFSSINGKGKKCNGFVEENLRSADCGNSNEPKTACEQHEIEEMSVANRPENLPVSEQHEDSNADVSPDETNLFSYEDTDYYSDYHFGLIRGYHREMYEDKQEQNSFLCCSLDRETVRRIKRRNQVLSCQVMSILFGAVFVFFGVTSLAISYIISSDETKEYFLRSLDVPSMYIHIIAIVGLTILTLGSALISLCLLVPIFVGQIHGQDMPGFWCTTGDLYVKDAEKTYNLAQNQFLYFDAALYGNFVGKSNVKKIQPELPNKLN